MNQLISIIIPVYNVELYLERCVESVRNQTYRTVEIILVNDGSLDSSLEICNNFVAKDNRIKVIHKHNGGLSSARNAGLDIASGEYIGFVDSDDFIAPDMYETLLKACIENNANISMCGRYNYKDDGTALPLYTLSGGKEVWSGKQAISNLLIWYKIDSSACDKLFRKNLFVDVRFPVGKVCEDVSIIPQMISNTLCVVHIGMAKYFYYQRKGSISRSGFSLNRFDMLDAHKKTADFIKLKYPDLSEKADHFYFHAFLYLYIEFYATRAFNSYFNSKKTIDDIARLNYIYILKNKYIPVKNKIVFVLIYLKMYEPLKKLRLFYRILFYDNERVAN